MPKGWEGEGWHLGLTETIRTVTTAWIPKEYISCLSGNLAEWLLNTNVVKEHSNYTRMIVLHSDQNHQSQVVLEIS